MRMFVGKASFNCSRNEVNKRCDLEVGMGRGLFLPKSLEHPANRDVLAL